MMTTPATVADASGLAGMPGVPAIPTRLPDEELRAQGTASKAAVNINLGAGWSLISFPFATVTATTGLPIIYTPGTEQPIP